LKLREAIKPHQNPQGSSSQQLQAYYALRSARRLVAASLIDGKQEFRHRIRRMKVAIENRKKKPDGGVYDALDIRDMEQSQVLWVGATTRQLKALAEFEVEMLGVITNRGLVPDEESIEAAEFMAT